MQGGLAAVWGRQWRDVDVLRRRPGTQDQTAMSAATLSIAQRSP